MLYLICLHIYCWLAKTLFCNFNLALRFTKVLSICISSKSEAWFAFYKYWSYLFFSDKVISIRNKNSQESAFCGIKTSNSIYFRKSYVKIGCTMCQENVIYYPSNASYSLQPWYLFKFFFDVCKKLFQFFILSMLMGW